MYHYHGSLDDTEENHRKFNEDLARYEEQKQEEKEMELLYLENQIEH